MGEIMNSSKPAAETVRAKAPVASEKGKTERADSPALDKNPARPSGIVAKIGEAISYVASLIPSPLDHAKSEIEKMSENGKKDFEIDNAVGYKVQTKTFGEAVKEAEQQTK